jgi:nitrite reductase (NADH) large subunit
MPNATAEPAAPPATVAGITPIPLFTISPELPRRLPQGVWRPGRWAGVAVGVGIAVTAVAYPDAGLKAFWSVFVPIAPLLFLVGPGLWRNLCPMASLNQLPRTLGFTRGLTVPAGVARVAPLVSAGLFFAIVPLRKVWLDRDGVALGVFLATVLTLAFAGGVVFKGKSGWCSNFCPMLSVERFYNLAPVALIPNSHCRPCVGCTRNCYDFNPTAAHLADLNDEDPRWRGYRTLFAGAIPWFIVAFNTQDPAPSLAPGAVAGVYGRLLLFAAAGAGVFHVVESVTRLGSFRVLLLHVVAAINLFYWYVTPTALGAFSADNNIAVHGIQALVAALSIAWLVRAWPREKAYEVTVLGETQRVAPGVLRAADSARGGQVAVTFVGGPTVMARAGETLLAVAEGNGVKIEAGCRMGMCGADPVKVLAGQDNITQSTGPERSTLGRIGAPPGCRMACVTKVTGPVTLSLDLSAVAEGEEGVAATPTRGFDLDPTARRVIVIGTGAAGVTAVTELRKLSGECELTIVGAEPYDFYNRMNIGKLVSEATSIDKLYMLPHDWAESRRITLLRGVSAAAIDRRERVVVLSSGERLPYDKVVIATGGQGNVPRLDGFGMEGTFVLRTLDDGVAIQQYIRRRNCGVALVVGGGLLGLEAAYSMTHLGVRVFVLDRNPWPLNRQLDQPAGALLWQLMKDLGIEVLPNTEARRFAGEEGRLYACELSDGTWKYVQVCLAAAGVTPDVALAAEAGLVTGRGIVVDDRLATSDPDIYAAGDAVEHRTRTYGLWPAAVDHARIAATNILGGDLRYEGDVPSCKLKVAGVDLLSVGEMSARLPESYEIRIEEQGVRRYRKLVVVDGKIRGGMLIGHPDLSDAVATAVEEHFAVDGHIDALRAGDWSVLPA